MRRPFVTLTFTMALALAPAASFAQATAAQQPPAAAQPAPQPVPPKAGFTSPVGILLVQIKPDQTAVFEEMIAKLKAGLAKTQDATLKQQAAGFKVYKAAEPLGANVVYVVLADPTVPNSEYELFTMLAKTMTDEEQRAPEVAEMWKRYQAAFAAGISKLSLTPVGGV
jgi:ABC-type Fe3+-hydroxamate transport system substrate-binding protein